MDWFIIPEFTSFCHLFFRCMYTHTHTLHPRTDFNLLVFFRRMFSLPLFGTIQNDVLFTIRQHMNLKTARTHSILRTHTHQLFLFVPLVSSHHPKIFRLGWWVLSNQYDTYSKIYGQRGVKSCVCERMWMHAKQTSTANVKTILGRPANKPRYRWTTE